mgnify:CR=1 FL=1
MIKAGIIGSTGYAGQELVRILTQHKDAEVVWYGSRSYIDQKYASVYHNMKYLEICSRSLMTNVWMITWMSLHLKWM